jgi:hypothetical protein
MANARFVVCSDTDGITSLTSAKGGTSRPSYLGALTDSLTGTRSRAWEDRTPSACSAG